MADADIPAAPAAAQGRPPAAANLQRGLSVPEAARLMNVSVRMVYNAQRLHRTGRDDLFRAVERGEMTINRALAIAEQKPPVTGVDRLRRAWNAATPAERDEFMRLLIQAGEHGDQGDTA